LMVLSNSDLRFRVAQMLWRQQPTFQAIIQHRPASVKSEDVKEIDALIGLFMEKAGPSYLSDLGNLRQGVRDRSLLREFGLTVTD